MFPFKYFVCLWGFLLQLGIIEHQEIDLLYTLKVSDSKSV